MDPRCFSCPVCHRTCLPCSLQVLSLLPLSLLFFYQTALERMDFLASYVSPYLPSFMQICLLWDEIYCLLHSFILGHDHMPPYLPSYLSPTYSISLCSLHCHASLRVFSSREESFSPTTFLSLLVPLVFPSAFFICLLIHYCCSLWVLFGARTSPCLPRVSRLYDL